MTSINTGDVTGNEGVEHFNKLSTRMYEANNRDNH